MTKTITRMHDHRTTTQHSHRDHDHHEIDADHPHESRDFASRSTSDDRGHQYREETHDGTGDALPAAAPDRLTGFEAPDHGGAEPDHARAGNFTRTTMPTRSTR